jgi:hypothetical protein
MVQDLSDNCAGTGVETPSSIQASYDIHNIDQALQQAFHGSPPYCSILEISLGQRLRDCCVRNTYPEVVLPGVLGQVGDAHRVLLAPAHAVALAAATSALARRHIPARLASGLWQASLAALHMHQSYTALTSKLESM